MKNRSFFNLIYLIIFLVTGTVCLASITYVVTVSPTNLTTTPDPANSWNDFHLIWTAVDPVTGASYMSSTAIANTGTSDPPTGSKTASGVTSGGIYYADWSWSSPNNSFTGVLITLVLEGKATNFSGYYTKNGNKLADATITVVPEPYTILLIGLGTLGVLKRR